MTVPEPVPGLELPMGGGVNAAPGNDGPGARRARRALAAAAAVFVVAAGWTAVSAVGLARDLGRDAATLSQELDDARYRAQPAFNARVDRARSAVASAGWGLGPPPPLPVFDCWQEADTTACDLFAHADGEVAMPVVPAQRIVAIDRLLSGTNAALARDGWRCTRPLARTADAATDCTSGTTQLRVSFRAASGAQQALTAAAAVSRIELRLDLSGPAYRSPGTT